MQAQADAMMTVLQAAMPAVGDSPTCAAAVHEIFDTRMTNRLCRGVDEEFVNDNVTNRLVLPLCRLGHMQRKRDAHAEPLPINS